MALGTTLRQQPARHRASLASECSASTAGAGTLAYEGTFNLPTLNRCLTARQLLRPKEVGKPHSAGVPPHAACASLPISRLGLVGCPKPSAPSVQPPRRPSPRP